MGSSPTLPTLSVFNERRAFREGNKRCQIKRAIIGRDASLEVVVTNLTESVDAPDWTQPEDRS